MHDDTDLPHDFLSQARADQADGYSGPSLEAEPTITAAQLLDSAALPPWPVRVSCCDSLAIAYPRHEPLFMARKTLGLERYGVELDPFNDSRDMLKETSEELADGCVYLRAEIERELERTRVNGRHRYLTLKQALGLVVKALDLVEEVRGG